jgi:hypothetical protein
MLSNIRKSYNREAQLTLPHGPTMELTQFYLYSPTIFRRPSLSSRISVPLCFSSKFNMNFSNLVLYECVASPFNTTVFIN